MLFKYTIGHFINVQLDKFLKHAVMFLPFTF